MIVAVALFAIVMLIAVGALLSVVEANRKAVAMQSVINNLNVAIDGMVRSIRQGTTYRCEGSEIVKTPSNCPNGGDWIVFTTHNGTERTYRFEAGDKRITVRENGGQEFPLTAPEVAIESVNFYVVGAVRTDEVQPKVMIVIKGTAGVKGKTNAESSFHIQATAVQRILDL